MVKRIYYLRDKITGKALCKPHSSKWAVYVEGLEHKLVGQSRFGFCLLGDIEIAIMEKKNDR